MLSQHSPIYSAKAFIWNYLENRKSLNENTTTIQVWCGCTIWVWYQVLFESINEYLNHWIPSVDDTNVFKFNYRYNLGVNVDEGIFNSQKLNRKTKQTSIPPRPAATMTMIQVLWASFITFDVWRRRGSPLDKMCGWLRGVNICIDCS